MKEVTPATKSRSTKLSKKTKEELIEVILRKDSVERKLNEKVIAYKTTIEEKINKISILKQTIGGLENACSKYKSEIENINSELSRSYDKIKNQDAELSKTKADLNSVIVQRDANENWAIEENVKSNQWQTISFSFIVISIGLAIALGITLI